eukprot:4007194-Pyramimonas_sp.AAC.1
MLELHYYDCQCKSTTSTALGYRYCSATAPVLRYDYYSATATALHCCIAAAAGNRRVLLVRALS